MAYKGKKFVVKRREFMALFRENPNNPELFPLLLDICKTYIIVCNAMKNRTLEDKEIVYTHMAEEVYLYAIMRNHGIVNLNWLLTYFFKSAMRYYRRYYFMDFYKMQRSKIKRSEAVSDLNLTNYHTLEYDITDNIDLLENIDKTVNVLMSYLPFKETSVTYLNIKLSLYLCLKHKIFITFNLDVMEENYLHMLIYSFNRYVTRNLRVSTTHNIKEFVPIEEGYIIANEEDKL